MFADALDQAIQRVISETKCPSCGYDGAYIGFNKVECPNPNCAHYSDKQVSSAKHEPTKPGIPGSTKNRLLMMMPTITAIGQGNDGKTVGHINVPAQKFWVILKCNLGFIICKWSSITMKYGGKPLTSYEVSADFDITKPEAMEIGAELKDNPTRFGMSKDVTDPAPLYHGFKWYA